MGKLFGITAAQRPDLHDKLLNKLPIDINSLKFSLDALVVPEDARVRIDKVGRRRRRQVEVQLVSRDDGDVDVRPTKGRREQLAKSGE